MAYLDTCFHGKNPSPLLILRTKKIRQITWGRNRGQFRRPWRCGRSHDFMISCWSIGKSSMWRIWRSWSWGYRKGLRCNRGCATTHRARNWWPRYWGSYPTDSWWGCWKFLRSRFLFFFGFVEEGQKLGQTWTRTTICKKSKDLSIIHLDVHHMSTNQSWNYEICRCLVTSNLFMSFCTIFLYIILGWYHNNLLLKIK